MTDLPLQARELAKRPDNTKILTTINPDGTPHSVVCASLFVPDPSTIGVGKVILKNTCNNLRRDPRAEFIIRQGAQAFSVQCRFREQLTDPESLAQMNEKLERVGHKASQVLMFDVLEVYSQGFGDDAGKRLA